MSCDLAANALSPRPSTSEARHSRLSSDAYGDADGDRRSSTEAANAEFGSASGGFRALLRIARETDPAGSTLLRTWSTATDRRTAEAPDDNGFSETARNSVEEDRPTFSVRSNNDEDTTAPSSGDETSTSARERVGGRDPDKDGLDENEPDEKDGDQAMDTSQVIALAVTLPVPSALLAPSASGNAQTASAESAGLQTGGSISAGTVADATRTTPGAVAQTPDAPPRPPSVQVQSIGEPVSSTPSHALLAGLVPLDAVDGTTGTPALAQNGAPGNSMENSAQHTAAAAPGQAAPPPAADASGAPGASAAAGTGPNALAAATPQNPAGTGGSAGGGAQDGQSSERDARPAEAVPDADLAVGGTEDSFAAGLTPATGNSSSPRAAAGSATAAAAAQHASTAFQVAQQLGKAAKSGLQRVEIALQPAALGQIDVRLEFGRDGRVAAHFTADSREALNALQADSRTLERALQDAGVRADSGSLGFSLRGESGGGHRSSFASPNTAAAPARNAGDATEGRISASTVGTGTDGRLDIHA